MSGFHNLVARHNKAVFLNTGHYAVERSVKYDGVTYEDICIVLSRLKSQERTQPISDHAKGLFLVSAILSCLKDDLGGKEPKQGQRLQINCEKGGSFFESFYVAGSSCELGMLRVELEAIDE